MFNKLILPIHWFSGTLLKAMLQNTKITIHFYTLPYYYLGHAISKAVALSCLALLLVVLVKGPVKFERS